MFIFARHVGVHTQPHGCKQVTVMSIPPHKFVAHFVVVVTCRKLKYLLQSSEIWCIVGW